MSTQTTDDLVLHTPVEGDGLYTSKALQWVDLCPHLGAAEKSLLRVLTNLTTRESPTRRIAPSELQQMVYSGPVDIGQAPKTVSSSGLLRLLRNLASLGQITTPDGAQLRFSSRASAQVRGVSMAVWRYPRHECGCARNAFDALAIARGEQPQFPPASSDRTAAWTAPATEQAGQLPDPPGYLPDPPGYLPDPRGQNPDPDTGSDQQEHDPPITPSSSFSSSSSVAPPVPAPVDRNQEEEEERPSAPKPRGRRRVASVREVIVEATGATDEEAGVLESALAEKATKSLSGFVRRLSETGDLAHQLSKLRASRARAAQPVQAPPQEDGPVCSEHDRPLPCRGCQVDVVKLGDRSVAEFLLKLHGPEARWDLAELLEEAR